jgi:hypothetical protein
MNPALIKKDFVNTTINLDGRLCNFIFINLAVSFIAEKCDLRVTYGYKNDIDTLGIPLFSGKTVYDNAITLTNYTFLQVYNMDSFMSNLYIPIGSYFQTREISHLIYKHLRTPRVMTNVIKMNPYEQRYNTNNDIFVHIRLTDVAHLNPGIKYYINTISKIPHDELYIASDDLEHQFIHLIRNAFPNMKIVCENDVQTVQFGSTCRNIILSHGTFSAMIGYLGYYSNVYYPEINPTKIQVWHGDVFSIDGWHSEPIPK